MAKFDWRPLAVLVGGGVVIAVIGVGAGYWISSGGGEGSGPSPTPAPAAARKGLDPNAPPPPPAEYDRASLTSEQTAALAGGKSAEWSQQGITWKIPKGWSRGEATETTCAVTSDAAPVNTAVVGTISPVLYEVEIESSLQGFYAGAVAKIKEGLNDEVRYLEIDGTKGVLWREAMPGNQNASRRLQWVGYRTFKGKKQLVGFIASTRAADFARDEAALYAILYATKIGK